MDNKKLSIWQIIILLINAIGIICLVYFGTVYFSFDMTIPNPDAMIPFAVYETGGMALLFGFFPLLVANILAFIFMKKPKTQFKLLFFIPSIVCISLVAHFLISDLSREDEAEEELFKINICNETDNEVYSLATSFGIGEEYHGGSAIKDAKNKSLEDECFVFYPEDFHEGTTGYEGFFADIYVCDDVELAKAQSWNWEEDYIFVDKITINPTIGDCYEYVLTGNSVDGYKLTVK